MIEKLSQEQQIECNRGQVSACVRFIDCDYRSKLGSLDPNPNNDLRIRAAQLAINAIERMELINLESEVINSAKKEA